MPELYVPGGHRPTPGKNRDGLYIGAVVVIQHTGYGVLRDGVEQPVTALVSYVYPDETTGTNRYGEQEAWLGDRPFINAMTVVVVNGEPTMLTLDKMPWATDVERQMLRQGIPQGMAYTAYRVVTRLEGIR